MSAEIWVFVASKPAIRGLFTASIAFILRIEVPAASILMPLRELVPVILVLDNVSNVFVEEDGQNKGGYLTVRFRLWVGPRYDRI